MAERDDSTRRSEDRTPWLEAIRRARQEGERGEGVGGATDEGFWERRVPDEPRGAEQLREWVLDALAAGAKARDGQAFGKLL